MAKRQSTIERIIQLLDDRIAVAQEVRNMMAIELQKSKTKVKPIREVAKPSAS
jgi:hypothetical protein